MKFAITVNQLWTYNPYPSDLAFLDTLAAELGLGYDKPVGFNVMLDQGGFKCAVWVLRTQPAALAQRLALRFAEIARYPDDLHPRQAIGTPSERAAAYAAADLAEYAAARAALAGVPEADLIAVFKEELNK
jgi:hypothetical protein